MKIEIRADGAMELSGYVNVPGRDSRPIRDPRGNFIETIKQGSFQRAIDRAEKIDMLVDHDKSRMISSTADGTLEVKEDAIGLRAKAMITDEETVKEARAGKLKGWSFDMKNIKSKFTVPADGELAHRAVSDFDMSEISIIINKVPCYSSTSVEVRSGEESITETRACEEAFDVVDNYEDKPKFDNSKLKERLEKLK